MATRSHLLALTMGEPGGIGMDITLAAWTIRNPDEPFVFIGNADGLKARAHQLGIDAPVTRVKNPQDAALVFRHGLPVLDIKLPAPAPAGKLVPQNAGAVIHAIKTAVELTTSGQTQALVTNPVHKKNLYDSGFKFPGHTEYLASLAASGGRTPKPVMMLACPALRVVPVTVHIALAQVAPALTRELITATAKIASHDLETRFGIKNPRLAIAGLNPHAGEGGGMGHEEQGIIAPAIADLRAAGIDAFGPLPPDTMFHEQARKTYDAALCMYHDQALIPLKTLDFHHGVNVTLGLPFLRTSPDHGTALDLAGTGRANPASLIAAMDMARQGGA